MMKTLSIEVARKKMNVACLLLHPGTCNTDMSEPFRRNVVRVYILYVWVDVCTCTFVYVVYRACSVCYDDKYMRCPCSTPSAMAVGMHTCSVHTWCHGFESYSWVLSHIMALRNARSVPTSFLRPIVLCGSCWRLSMGRGWRTTGGSLRGTSLTCRGD